MNYGASRRRTLRQFKLAVLVCLFLIAALLPVSLYDRQVFLALNSLHTPWTDVIWFAFTSLGDGLVIGIVLGAFLVKDPRVTALGLTLVLMSSAILHLIKWIDAGPRPAAVLEICHVVGPVLKSACFPSGHTASATAAALAVMTYSRSPVVMVAAGAFAVLVGLSRIFVGAHWPSDVIGGMALSIGIFALLFAGPWQKLEKRVPSTPQFGSREFQWPFFIEIVTVIFTLFVYSNYFSAAPVVTAAAALCVLAALSYGWLRRPLTAQTHDAASDPSGSRHNGSPSL